MTSNEGQFDRELSSEDLEALDLLLGLAKASGRESVSSDDFLHFWPFVAVVLREAVKWALRTSICVAQSQDLDENSPYAKVVASLPGEVPLDQLIAIRDRYK